MRRLNRSAKIAFYNARKREGDLGIIALYSGYSSSHVSNVLAGRRSVPETVAVVAYQLSKSRKKNSQLVG